MHGIAFWKNPAACAKHLNEGPQWLYSLQLHSVFGPVSAVHCGKSTVPALFLIPISECMNSLSVCVYSHTQCWADCLQIVVSNVIIYLHILGNVIRLLLLLDYS